MLSRSADLCVVGAGPRGISVVERMCANAPVLGAPGDRVTIHLVDSRHGGGGQVWRTDQPAELLMNTVASQVSMFMDDSVEGEGPVVNGPSLHEWARALDGARQPGRYPEQVLAEAATLGPDSYASRSLYGHYVDWALARVRAGLPDSVEVVLHRAVAVALDDDGDGTQTLRLDDGTSLSGLTAVVLAQGHVGMELTPDEKDLSVFAHEHGLGYFPPGNPADTPEDSIRPGESVALRGLGLNFFDHMAMLTAGRGGRFERVGGRLVYRPSGAEPVLYAGSRRGVPYHARGENQKGPAVRHQPVFLTPQAVRALQAESAAGRRLRFRRDIWPIVSREVRLVYYRTLLAERDGAAAADAFAGVFTVLSAGEGDEAECALLDRYDVARQLRWDWDRVIRPYGTRTFSGPDDYRAWLLGYLRSDLREAARGNVRGPLKAALDVLRDLRNEIRLIVDHGGITGSSYRSDLQEWYTPLNAFLSIGPPASRIEEMIALVEAGVLTLLGPGFRVLPDASGKCFQVESTAVPGPAVQVTSLVEARLPEVDIRRTTDPLLRHLLGTGQCSAYGLADESGPEYRTGGLAVTRRPYHVVDAEGRAHPRRFAFGVPTETVHWVTAAGIRPGVNSVILSDADIIARAALRAAPEPARDAVPAGSQ
ncbi:FAD/NAD(P)-binding protein [Streptomyces sp. NPDC059398]|uniref:FAD/NAD(P)-binding protein n=1 Tax=Streptomyces sp. NPDC059398 TaxID=3346820 RepID=UPI0036CA67A1